jgi:hypothetical protein
MADSSWVSISSLVKTPDISYIYHSSSSGETSPTVPREWQPNTHINSSKTGYFMRDKLADGTLESTRTVDSDYADLQLLTGQIQKKNAQLAKMEHKYEALIRTLQTELKAVKAELASTCSEVARLNSDRMTLHQDYERQLVNLNSKRIRQRRKSLEDVELYMANVKTQWCSSFENLTQTKLKAQIASLHDHYEEKIEALKIEHELEISQKEDEYRLELDSLKLQLSHASVSKIPRLSVAGRRS